MHDETSSISIENPGEGIPGSECGHAAVEFWHLVQPLKHRDVGIRTEIIALYAGVRMSGEQFVVTGVGELEAIRDAGQASLLLVAVDLSVASDLVPQEWKQS